MGRKIEQRSRKREIQNKLKSVILFGFEGKNKTETIYFSKFQSGNNPFNIRYADGNNTDPVGMIKDVINTMKREDISIEKGDKIYCLIDADVNKNNQTKIDEAIRLASSEGIEIIMSVPSFEIWYRLHYDYTTGQYSSSEAVSKDLKKYISNYDKNSDVFDLLKDRTSVAIEQIKKLEKHHKELGQDVTKEDCNPYTAVYKPVEYILKPRVLKT